MKVVIVCVLAVATLAASAPTPKDVVPTSLPELRRQKRSQYGGQGYGAQPQFAAVPQHAQYGAPQLAPISQFVPVSSFGGASPYGGVQSNGGIHGIPFGFAPISPCAAAAASAPIPAIAPASFMAPHAGFSSHGYGGYAAQPHYRAEDIGDEFEMESMTSEHMPMARYAYGGAPAGHIGGGIGSLMAPYSSPAGPAVGLFPNANIGGCGVPLLLSCSPNVVAGKIVSQPAQPQHYSYGGVAPNLGLSGVGLGMPQGGGISLSSASLGVSGGNAYRDVDEPTHERHEEQHLEHAAAHEHPTSHEVHATGAHQ